MHDAIPALVVAVPTVAIVFTAYFAAIRQLRVLHLQMNSRLDELLEATRQVAHAAGMEAQRQIEHPETQ